MTWLKTIIPSAPDALEDTQARLTAMGIDSFQTEDERDIAAAAPGWEMADQSLLDYYTGLCRVIVYLPDAPNGLDTLAALRSAFPDVAVEAVKEEDWAENWKQYYKPFTIGKRLLVHPAWEPLGDTDGRAVFLNNPGMTFGTGLHASTRLCLELIDAYIPEGRSMLDVGSGSGILSVCSLLLGAANAVCVDIDPLAAEVSVENAARNGVEVTALCGDILTDAALRESLGGGYGLICSNIVADVIIALCPLIPAMLAPDGVWIVSGIIDSRLGDVKGALIKGGFKVFAELDHGGWAALAVLKEERSPRA